jgi:hypothetical protein
MMVEGVGASAESVVRQILGAEDTSPWRVSWIEIGSRWLQNWVKATITGQSD